MNLCTFCQTKINDNPFCNSRECRLNIHNRLNLYTQYIQSSEDFIEYVVKNLVTEIAETRGIIFLCGVGKEGNIAHTIISSWQSLGIRTHFISPQDRLQGITNIIREEDMILYLNTSGESEELLQLASLLQQKNIKQILISMNPTASLNVVVDTNYVISNTKIIDEDILCILYKIVLDMIGLYIVKRNQNL